MQKIFINSFKILKNNMLFVQPLLLFFLIEISGFTYIASKNINFAPKIILLISLFLLMSAFLAGWFYINKLGIEDFNPEDSYETSASKSVKNFKLFFTGVGENFFKFLSSSLLYFALYAFCVNCLTRACVKFIGEPAVFDKFMQAAMSQNQNELLNLTNSINTHEALVFVLWILAFAVFTMIFNYFGILYAVIITAEKINIFSSLWKTIKFFILNIFSSILIMIVLFGIYFFINLLAAPMGTNSIAFVILIILCMFYLNYYVILVSYYYNEKTKSNSDSGAEFIGQNATGD